jgi:hypothetical protein
VSTEAEDTVEIRCQAKSSDDIEELMCAIVSCKVHKLVKRL